MKRLYSYLALGDSYTIGEAVPLNKNFPYQLVRMLRKKGYSFFAPEILAKTGWTTDELQSALDEYEFLPTYDFATLLIGVNNQYRGYSLATYEKEFTALLSQTIFLASNNPGHVFVLSIPDYSISTFARKLNVSKIRSEINQYNERNRNIATTLGAHYIDITVSSRDAANDASLLATDGLHPSEKEYEKWASILNNEIHNQLNISPSNYK